MKEKFLIDVKVYGEGGNMSQYFFKSFRNGKPILCGYKDKKLYVRKKAAESMAQRVSDYCSKLKISAHVSVILW